MIKVRNGVIRSSVIWFGMEVRGPVLLGQVRFGSPARGKALRGGLGSSPAGSSGVWLCIAR